MIRNMFALGAMAAALGLSHPGVTNSPPGGHFVTAALDRPAENPECPAIARTIEHWLPHVRNRSDDYRAAVAVDDYVNPVTLHWLNRWVGEVGGAFDIYSVGGNGAPPMRQGLEHVRLLCPSLPASVVSVPLPG